MIAEALAEFFVSRLAVFCGGYDVKSIVEQGPCIDQGIAQSFSFIETDNLILKATVLKCIKLKKAEVLSEQQRNKLMYFFIFCFCFYFFLSFRQACCRKGSPLQ